MTTTLTIKDIAKLAGVSHATVSRVLNNSAKIKAETLLADPEPRWISTSRGMRPARAPEFGTEVHHRDVDDDPFERRYPAEFLPPSLAGMTTELNAHGYNLTLYFDQIQDQRDQVPSSRAVSEPRGWTSAPSSSGGRHCAQGRTGYGAGGVGEPAHQAAALQQRDRRRRQAGGDAGHDPHCLRWATPGIAFVEGVPHHGSNIDRKAGYLRALRSRG